MVRLFCNMKKNIRLWVQVLFAAFTNGYVLGFLKGKIYTGPSKALCLPGLNCYSCPGSLGSCPIGALQSVLGSNHYRFSFYVIGFLLLTGSLLGRFVCGWLCPFGLVQDLLYKIPFLGKKAANKRKNLPGHKFLIWLKYIVLAVFVIALPLTLTNFVGLGKPWFCQYICPSGTLFAGIPLVASNEFLRAAIGALFNWKVGLLLAILILSMAVYRPFCKYLCPLGAVYSLFNGIALYSMSVENSKCIKCGKCESTCKMGVVPHQHPNHLECIRCRECIKACPTSALYDSLRSPHRQFRRRGD